MSIQSYAHVLKQTHISQNKVMSKDTREHARTRARTHTSGQVAGGLPASVHSPPTTGQGYTVGSPLPTP